MADKENVKGKTRQIYEILPHLDDQRCGYRTCGEFAHAVAEGKAPCDGCIMGVICSPKTGTKVRRYFQNAKIQTKGVLAS